MALVLVAASTVAGAEPQDRLLTATTLDTLYTEIGDSVLSLSRPFVIEGTERVTVEGIAVTSYRIQSLSGRIILDEPDSSDSRYVVSYRYLTTSFPTRFDPPLASLPRLEGASPSTERLIDRPLSALPKAFPLVADGTVFRGFSISPSTGMSLDGGLRLNLQGRLSDDMVLSGTLSDQNSPIPAGGQTQTLNEIDKVYLEVNHPSAKIQAGDLDMSLPMGQFLNVFRRLEGLHIKTQSASGAAEGYLGGTRGRFHRQEIRGEDGNQGPYSLPSETGHRNIQILAGSEKVWVDGERMLRGENHDYVIDYTRGDITFTPARMIDSNRRIYVEFEYSDLAFRRNLASLALQRTLLGNRATVSVGWVREQDNQNSQLPYGLGVEERRVLAQSGDFRAKIMTASMDSSGDYVRRINPDDPPDSVFVHVSRGDRGESEPLYRVSFHNLGSQGHYRQEIGPDGSLTYEYVPEDERISGVDLFVPFRPIPSPESHQMLNVATEVTLFDSSHVRLELAGSHRDRNLFSRLDDRDNLGSAGSVDFQHTQPFPGQAGTLILGLTSQRLDGRFSALQRDREVEFDREWNLFQRSQEQMDAQTNNLTVNTVKLGYRIGQGMKSTITYGTYSDPRQDARRWHGSTTFSSDFFPHVSLDVTRSARLGISEGQAGESVWYRKHFGAILLPGWFHPYVRYEEEERTDDFQFQESSGGLKADGDRMNAGLGITRRLEFTPGSRVGDWEPGSVSWLGEVDVSGRWPSGYRFRLRFKERLKTGFGEEGDLITTLARGTLAYRPRRGMLSGDLDVKLEQTLFEQRIAVYDSVGRGVGQYRYDPVYAEYVADGNGEYMVRFVHSGIRTPAKHLVTGMNLALDFRHGPWVWLHPFRWRAHGGTDYTGENLDVISVIRPSTDSPGINLARFRFQQDLNFIPPGSRRRVRVSSRHSLEVSGAQVTGWMEKGKDRYEISLEEPIGAGLIGTASVSGERNVLNSPVQVRNRTVGGWATMLGVRWKASTNLESGGDLHVGEDRITRSHDEFSAHLRGAGLHALWFPGGGGRLQARIEYYTVSVDTPLQTPLPTESSRGLPLGPTYRASLAGLFVLGSNISANMTMGYTLDSIHDQIFSISGDLRATF